MVKRNDVNVTTKEAIFNSIKQKAVNGISKLSLKLIPDEVLTSAADLTLNYVNSIRKITYRLNHVHDVMSSHIYPP